MKYLYPNVPKAAHIQHVLKTEIDCPHPIYPKLVFLWFIEDEACLSNCSLKCKSLFDSDLTRHLVNKRSLFITLISVSEPSLLLNPIAVIKNPVQEVVQIPSFMTQISDHLSLTSVTASP